jgi:hypothetical protein
VPINGLSGAVRTPRWARIRLGYTKPGKRSKYPSDSDVFVVRREGDPEITDAILKAYGGRPIPDAAEQGVFGIGRTIRLLLPWEYDTMHEGREVSLELSNRSWAASKLRCSGNGGGAEPEVVGTATCRDQQYLGVLQRAGLVIGDGPRGTHTVTCKGPDCPLWHSQRSDGNKLPGCHREMRLQALLLHPATDPEDPNYMRQLGWVEVATGSWHGVMDVQSGLAMLRATVGRTHHIPFALRRIARSISTPEGRVVKSTLVVSYEMDEAMRFALGPPARALLRPEVRRELLELAAAEVQFEAVADIQPQPDRGRVAIAPTGRPRAAALPPPPVIDRDDAVDAATRAAETDDSDEPEGREEVPRPLAQPEVDELKVACGGTPGQRDTLARYRELVEASYVALGVQQNPGGPWVPYPGTAPGAYVAANYLTTRHRAWIEEQLHGAGAQADGDEPDVVEGQLVDPDDEAPE